MAREVVPEAWQPTAEVVGGLLGGVAAAGATAPGALARGRSVIDNLVTPARNAAPKRNSALIDYSHGFDDDAKNFMPGSSVYDGPLDSELKLVSYHADAPLSPKRSAKWWTTTKTGNRFSTIGEVQQGLALLPEWGKREAVSVMTIPRGDRIAARVGHAERQTAIDGSEYKGGAIQFRFKYIDPAWSIVTRRIP